MTDATQHHAQVKPLEWFEGNSFPAEKCWTASSALGVYTIDQEFGSDAYDFVVYRVSSLIGNFEGLPEAKAIAQADYEARIRSALLPPVPVNSYEELRAENEKLRAALIDIAALEDEQSNAHLAATGSYSMFDERYAVEKARTALDGAQS
ncbi:MAG: hypothetical protein JWQ74_3559 [Marmoricola sp.]|nr:hypothetical protein [Marmoricola sp.]